MRGKADPAFQADFAVAARELDEARRAGR